MTPRVCQALKEMRGSKAACLVFQTGRYHFWPDRAYERYLFVSNNDEGLKHIAFPLIDLEDFEIDGQGSEFIFHEFVVPFAVLNCKNLRMTNFTMDWERTFHNELEVLDIVSQDGFSPATLDLRVPLHYPYQIKHGQLGFIGEAQEVQPLGYMLEFDAERRETAFRVHDNYAVRHWHHAEEKEPGIVRLTTELASVPAPGSIAVFSSLNRLCPGVVVADSAEIAISDVIIRHCGGMGVIAQRTSDIQIIRLQVSPAAHQGRMVSATADATHFVNCRGLIEMTDCLFENQMDDPANIHGIYARIFQVVSATEIEVEMVHGQQRGVDITQAGDVLEFVAQENLLTLHEAGVVSVDRLNRRFTRITLDAALPPEVTPGDAVASLSWTPDVTIRGCTARNNRARGFLISTAGMVQIENNHFHTPGAAILIAGDANYWFESGAVRDVAIRNNHFDNCNFGLWGQAAIEVRPEIAPENRRGVFYHRNIRIEGNTFDAFDLRLVKAHCVDGLIIRDNLIRDSEAYPAQPAPENPFDVTDSRHVEISGNAFETASAAAVQMECVACT